MVINLPSALKKEAIPNLFLSSNRRWTSFFALICIVLASFHEVEAQEFSSGSSNSEPLPTWRLAINYILIVLLTILSGICAGLTLGLMSLDRVGLEIILGAGEKPSANEIEIKHAKYAKRIYPIRRRGNLLLCTLIVFNVAVNALLSILMADLTSGLVGFLISTTVITVFGEIVPQATCTRYALKTGYYGVPIVKVMIVVIYPIAKPLSMILDLVMGEEIGTIHSTSQLRELLAIHVKHKALGLEEAEIMHGAMKFKDREVQDVMTPKTKVYMIPASARLNFEMMSEIFRSGYSRVPVYGKDINDVVGLLYTKDLIFVDPEDETPVLNFIQIFGRGVIKVWPDSKLGNVLKLFKQGKSHIALVQDVNNKGEGDPFYEFVGVITLEDIIEEILQDEILDETDAFVNNENEAPPVERNFDFGRLRLLDHRITDCSLSHEEVVALSAHLRANHKPLFESNGDTSLSEESIRNLLRSSVVKELKRTHQPEDELFTMSKATSSALIILSGKVEIRVGREEFRVEVGPWTLIAGNALSDEHFAPDFTAKVLSDKLRVLWITRECYENVVYCTSYGVLPPTPVAGNRSINASPRVLVDERPLRIKKITYKPVVSVPTDYPIPANAETVSPVGSSVTAPLSPRDFV